MQKDNKKQEKFKPKTKGYDLDWATEWRFDKLLEIRPFPPQTLVKIAIMEYMDRNNVPYPTEPELKDWIAKEKKKREENK